MPNLAKNPPARRADLVLGSPGADGRQVVKDPRSGAYFKLGEQEAFLLRQLDGARTTEAISAAFEERFGQPLPEEDLHGFLEVAQASGFLQPTEGSRIGVADEASGPIGTDDDRERPARSPAADQPPPLRSRVHLNLLVWRIRLFDPDRLFDWLEPKLRFVWTGPFLALSAGCILAGLTVAWTNRQELALPLMQAPNRVTLLLACFTLFAVTTGHEFAHGLTCKHHGGEVHEVGVLVLYMMPCLYCNVSDSWLFSEKSKRIWVTLAGGYFDLILWALALFAWRLTLQESPLNHLAWTVLSVCGVRTFFNFNPLLKLDGYYLLGDLVGIHNLRQRGLAALMGHVRWLLWGAPRPGREALGKFLVAYGVAAWLFTLSFVSLILGSMVRMFGSGWWVVSLGVAAMLGAMTLRELFEGFFAGEVKTMLFYRRKRAAIWMLIGGIVPAVLTLGQVEHVAKGLFQVRPLERVEVRAPVAGFLQAVYQVQGDRVSPGTLIARLEVADLASRIAQKGAELREARAKLRLLEEGTRREEVVVQRGRVERSTAWCNLGRQDLKRAQLSLQEDLARLEGQIAQFRTEYDHAAGARKRAKALFDRRALGYEPYLEEERKCRVCFAQLQQAEAQKRARQAEGTVAAEAELVRREQAVAEAQAALILLEAGTRPEEIEAARAFLARLVEEANYLEGIREKLLISSPMPGLVTTPRLREKIGQYVREGELICEIKASTVLEAEISLAEQDVARVRNGQRVELKVRALPFHTFSTRVDRIAPSAVKEERPGQITGQSPQGPTMVTIYCRLENPAIELRPGMTGYARIACGRHPIGEIAIERLQGFLRTEFWW